LLPLNVMSGDLRGVIGLGKHAEAGAMPTCMSDPESERMVL